MRGWFDLIYGNDIAQNTVSMVLKAVEEGKSLTEILDLMRTRGWAGEVETELVIADVEYHFVGRTKQVKKTFQLIHKLKENVAKDWFNPEKRLETLEAFETMLMPKAQPLPFACLAEWLQERADNECLCKTMYGHNTEQVK